MPVAKITGQGLAAIAVLVCLLWGCLLAERSTVARARAETIETMRALRHMRARGALFPAVRRDIPYNLTDRQATL
jgi:hypothetical protein